MADDDSSESTSRTTATSSRGSKREKGSKGDNPVIALNTSSKKKDKDRSKRASSDLRVSHDSHSEGASEESFGAPKNDKEKEKDSNSKSSHGKKAQVESVKDRRVRSSSMSAAESSKIKGHTRDDSETNDEEDVRADFHKFQPKTTSKPLTCKICNKYIWGGGGYTCAGCKCAVHTKVCAAKAREERGCPKPLLSPFLREEDLQRFGEADLFKINMPDLRQKTLIFSPTLILADLLAQIDVEHKLKNFCCFGGEGKPLYDTEVSLAKVKTSHVYYVPKGMPLAMVPGLLGFGQTIQLLAVKSEEQKSRRASNAGNRRALFKESKKSHEGAEEVEGRKGVITLTLKHARSLVVHDDFEYVYAIISSPNTGQHFRSIPVPFSPNAEWNQPFKVTVNNVDDLELHFKIWTTSKNASFADSVIGQLSIDVKDFSDGDSVNKIYPLKKEPKKLRTNKANPGQLRVKWKFVERHFRPSKIDVPPGESDDEQSNDEDLDMQQSETQDQDEVVSLESSPLVVASENVDVASPPAARKKKRITDIYQFGPELGRGAYSVVKLLYRKDNRQSFAVKIMDNYSNMENAEEEEQNFRRETTILKKLNHPNICRLYDIFKDREHYYVVLENVAGGELFDQIMERGSFPEDEAAALAKQLFSALVHVHAQGFAHRDIKPENLLFSDDTHTQLKLVDFGEAKSTKKGPLNDYVGTPDYMAPEVVKGTDYTCKVDCWSAGVVVYILLCGFPPFEGESEAEVYINIMNLNYDFPSPDWDKISEEAKDFIRQLLAPEEKRLSAEEALKHPWFLKFAPN